MNYNEINAMFPTHNFFYSVNGMSMNDALEHAARLSGYDSHVVNLNGQIVLATVTSIGTDIPWARPVNGNPDPAPSEEAPQ